MQPAMPGLAPQNSGMGHTLLTSSHLFDVMLRCAQLRRPSPLYSSKLPIMIRMILPY